MYQASFSGYEPLPNQEVTRLLQTYHSNNWGMRGGDVEKVPPKGIQRILTLGDSVNNGGSQVNDENTYPAQLEKLYKNSGRAVEVLNSSAGGWAIENEYKWIFDHGLYGASTVILEFNEKDLDQKFVDASILDGDVSFPKNKPIFALQEIYFRYLLPKLRLSQSADPGSTASDFDTSSSQNVLKIVSALHDFTSMHQAKLIILYWDLRDDGSNMDVIRAREKLFSFAASQHIKLLRPKTAIGKGWGSEIFRDVIHPNAYGNKMIAEFVFNNAGV